MRPVPVHKRPGLFLRRSFPNHSVHPYTSVPLLSPRILTESEPPLLTFEIRRLRQSRPTMQIAGLDFRDH